MKILVVQDYLRSGGTERQSLLLAKAFAEAGHETELLTFRPRGELWPASSSHNPNLSSLQRFDTRLDWWAPGLMKRASQWQADIVMCMGRVANSYGGALQQALPAAQVVSTLRTGKSLPWLFKKSLRLTRHLIANSQAAADHATAHYQVPPDRLSVIHNALVNGPDLSARDDAAATRAQYGAGAEEAILLDVAMFRPEKNHLTLIEMAARLPEDVPWQLWLAGDGSALPNCRQRVAALGLAPRVQFLGLMADPRPLYRAADIAVHASRRESLSNFLIEAQAHGLPVVAAAARGVQEAFLDGESGFLIAPDDLHTFTERVTQLLHFPDRREAMGERARAQANQRFSRTASVMAHLDLFEKLVSSPPAA